jgi:hypothetical protein
MKLNDKTKFLIAGGVLALLFVILFFYYLNRATNRLGSETATVPNNSQFEVLDSSGNLVAGNQPSPSQNSENQSEIQLISEGPVAGFRIVENDFGVALRYISAETGQIYNYLPGPSATTRLTTDTLLAITRAQWVGNDHILLTYYAEGQPVNLLAQIDLANARLNTVVFPQTLESIAKADDDQAYYLLRDNEGSSLYRYQFDTGRSNFVQAFDISALDLRDIDGESDLLLATTKIHQSHDQAGLIIDVADNSSSLLQTGVEFSQGALLFENFRVLINQAGLVLQNIDSGEDILVAGNFVVDKCAVDLMSTGELVCAEVILTSSQLRNWPTNWFRGQLRPVERLVAINPQFGSKRILADLGSQYDISYLQTSADDIYFINRRDGRLYSYEVANLD